jgi:type VI secretion system protein ImpF
MAELTQKERLQPSLLDRLTDRNPRQTRESRDERVLSLRQLRESILRDLAWLLNTENLESVHDFDDAPEVRHSVLNFGIPTMAGTTASGTHTDELERTIRGAILAFEPRLLTDSVQVHAAAIGQMNRHALTIEIEAEMWAQPVPLRMFLRTELDLETGEVEVTEQSR